jgi:hypothetical protein
MNIDQVKVKLVHDIMEIQDEQILIGIENLITSISDDNGKFISMSKEDLENRIEKSEKDFAEGRVITNEQLIAKYS